MDNLENLKDKITIPLDIDLAVKSGIEKGRKEKKRNKIHKKYKGIAVAAAVTVAVGIINPNIVRAIPGIQSIFKLLDHGYDGENFERFEKSSTSVNKTVESNGVKLTIDEIAIDNNTLAITTTAEGKNFKEGRGYIGNIELNGKSVSSLGSKDKLVDGKIVTVTYANVSDLELSKDVDVHFNIIWIGDIKGPWDFKFKVSKADNLTNSKVISLNSSIKIPNSTLKLEKLVISSLGNTIIYSGRYDKPNKSMEDSIFNFIVLDDKGRTLQTKAGGASSDKEKYNGKIEILEDLSDVKKLTEVPKFKQW